jgi:AmmeMemoRadiSam system protein B
VELPLLQVRNPDVKILPMVVGTADLARAEQVALALGMWLEGLPEKPLVVVSSDMSHYESDETTRRKDRYALEAIQALDGKALARAVHEQRVTMCGFIPAYMLLIMKEALGIRSARLVDYRTSADASGDTSRVVGYAGFIFE